METSRSSRRWPLAWLATLFFLLHPSSFIPLFASGFTEPPIIFYGTVTNNFDGYALPITSGQLTWTITPASGAPLVLTTPLREIAGGFSYRLEIPVEKVPGGFTLSPGALPTTSASYTRDGITLDGEPIAIVAPPLPAGATFTFAENQRGKIARVDLALSSAFLDSDEDGVPDWWEDLYGYDKFDPNDVTVDDDGDQADNFSEYRDHTAPDAAELNYVRWAALHALTGANYPFTTDVGAEGIPNGIEFAVDTDPYAADLALAQSRFAVAPENIGGEDYLVMIVIKPAVPRFGLAYIVESSTGLNTWGAVEGTDIVTLQNTASILRVRQKQSRQTPGVTAGFLRLRVIEIP